jgi:hypothetical protein
VVPARAAVPARATALVTSIASALAASLHALHWNQPIYHAGREWLIEQGMYADRMWFQLATGAVLLLALGFAAVRGYARLRRSEPLLRVAFAAAALDLLYIGTRTLSVDAWIPAVLAVEPGKTALAATLAVIALLAALCSKPRKRTDDDEPGGRRAFFLE